MKKIVSLLLLALASGSLAAQTFPQFIQYLNGLPQNERQAKVDSFSHATGIYPTIESDTVCHFIYQGNASTVTAAGDFTSWQPTMNLTNITGTDFWYATGNYDADSRLDYKYVINSGNWIVDPRNPYTCTGGFGPNSELRMPAYLFPPEVTYYPQIPHGTLWDSIFFSKTLGNSRKVQVYLPAGYPQQGKTYPVILFHDGPDYITFGAINNILDYLIAQHQIEEIIAVFVPAADRQAEYAGTKINSFTDFVVNGIMPEIDRKFATSKDPHQRANFGVSEGGNIALYVGMKHPEVFGMVCAQSSDVIPAISNGFRDGPKLDLRLFIDIGKYDLDVLMPLVNNLKHILEDRNYQFQFRQWHEGHSWGNWKGHMGVILRQFFPYPDGLNENKIPAIRLYQNQPNPSSSETAIHFTAPEGCEAELSMFDASGKKIRTLFNGKADPLKNLVHLYCANMASGTYIYTLTVDQYSISRKMNIIH
jgi:enterochelin esterase-like enzyme